MKKSRLSEAQIIKMIEEQEVGMATAEVCRRHGLSPATFYKLKAKYGGMDVSDAHRSKALEDEDGKLKRLLAEAMLDNANGFAWIEAMGRHHSHQRSMAAMSSLV